ncbi:MAG TPA: PHP domain-containing protein [Myxococcaceae bacterium]|nr:PHP domain-containing protein [Myxococcaceae bacterium]
MKRPSMVLRPIRRRRKTPGWIRLLRAALLLLALTLGWFALLAAVRPLPLTPPPATRELRGAWHVHTTRSDGRGSPTDVARAAREAGLDFLVLTDHNPRDLPTPAREEGVLLVAGEESSTPFGHLADVGSRRALTDAEKVSAPVRAVLELGGLAIVSHPLHPQRAWTDLSQARSASGVEVWSGDSAWGALRQRPLTRLLPALGTALVSPERALVYALAEARPAESWLLSLDGPEPKLAFCGPDAHGWPSYGAAFRWMSVHLTGIASLPEAPAEAAQALVQELRAGRFYCAVDALAPVAGFAVLPADRRTFRVGDVLEVRLPGVHPPGTRIVVHGPGRVLDASHVRLEAPGQVLVEVRVETPGLGLGDVSWPWLLAQPVKVEAPP